MTPVKPSAPSYPDNLASIPENARVREAFGWPLLSWACVLIVWCSVLFTQPAKPTPKEYALAAVAFFVALGMVFFEFYRRKNRRVLARLPESPEIGIYKRGKLERTVRVEEVTLDLRYSGAALATVIAPASVAFGLAVFLLPSSIAISSSERIDAAWGVLCFASLAASSVKTWWLCEFCLFPHEKRKRPERILASKRDLKLLLSRKAE